MLFPLVPMDDTGPLWWLCLLLRMSWEWELILKVNLRHLLFHSSESGQTGRCWSAWILGHCCVVIPTEPRVRSRTLLRAQPKKQVPLRSPRSTRDLGKNWEVRGVEIKQSERWLRRSCGWAGPREGFVPRASHMCLLPEAGPMLPPLSEAT